MEKFDLFFYEQNYKEGICRFDLDGQTVMMSEGDDRYTVQIESAFPNMVCTMKHYYADTLTLMTEGDYLKEGSCRIGVWKTYNRAGEVVEETDYEKDWNVSWESLLPFIVAEKIDLKAIVGISRCILNGEDEAEEVKEKEGEEELDEKEKEGEEGNTAAEENKSKDMAENEVEEEEDEWLDEEELVDEEEEHVNVSMTEVEEENERKPEPVKCWIIAVLLSQRVKVEHYFSGDTGEKLCENYCIIK